MNGRYNGSKGSHTLSSDSESEMDNDLFVNPNHIQSLVICSGASDDEEISVDESICDNSDDDSKKLYDDIRKQDVAIKTVIDNIS